VSRPASRIEAARRRAAGFAGLLAGVFIAIHGAGLLVDHFFDFTLSDLLLPGSTPYRPLATASGS
jgi:hypothetical protein